MTAIRKLTLSTALAMSLITIMGACNKTVRPDQVRKPATPAWAGILEHYQSLGEHRSGTSADQATGRWLRSEMRERG